MKLTAVFFNYKDDATVKVLSSDTEPTPCNIPDSCVIKRGKPFFIPDFAPDFALAPSAAIRIDRLGKSISRKFAPRYYSEIAPALLAVSTRTLEKARSEGCPWSPAICFDRSVMLGDFIAFDKFMETGGKIEYLTAHRTSATSSQTWDINLLDKDIDTLIEMLSRDNTMKTGDIILAGVSPAAITLTSEISTVSAEISQTQLLYHKIR